MQIFFFILLHNIAPIFFLISLAYFIARKFPIDVNSFSKINFYVMIPILVVSKLYKTRIDSGLLKVFLFGIVLHIALYLLALVISRLRKYDHSKESAIMNIIEFYNAAIFGLPLIGLVFRDSPQLDYIMSVQIMIMMVQNLLLFTVGFYNAGRGNLKFKDSLKTILGMPPIYAMLVALIMKLIPYDFTQFFLWPSFEYVENGFFAFALILLGIQLSRAEMNFKDLDIYIAGLARLLGGPALGFLLIKLFGFSGYLAQALLVSTAIPSALVIVLISVEFDNKPSFVSQAVLTNTLLSAFTLTGIIYLSQFLF